MGFFIAIPVVRYVLYPAVKADATDEMWSDVGKITDFAVAEPQQRSFTIIEHDGWAERLVEKTVWVIRNSDDSTVVFTAVCPHLGCTIKWRTEVNNFNCGCHQSTFDVSGKLVSGPAPRPMDLLETKVDGGTLLVRYQNFKQLKPTKEVLG
jgi:menaquinol-cytochrome c reductase iron-sulfur subunit